jgi:nucleotide-binding universal stress UspA family protein
MKILLATDGSNSSEAAVNTVAERPWPMGSEVKIVSAMEFPYAPTTDTWVLPNKYYKDLEEAAKIRAEASVNEAVERIESDNQSRLQISSEIINGPARDVIVDEADKWDADLIVVGSHGYNRWQRLFLGSVSNAVAAHAHCSVEIVRQKHEAEDENDG